MVTVTLFSPLTFVSRKGDNRLGEGARLAPLVLRRQAPYALPLALQGDARTHGEFKELCGERPSPVSLLQGLDRVCAPAGFGGVLLSDGLQSEPWVAPPLNTSLCQVKFVCFYFSKSFIWLVKAYLVFVITYGILFLLNFLCFFHVCSVRALVFFTG